MELPFCRSKIVEYRRFHMVQLTVCVVHWNRKFSSWKFYVCAVFSIQPPFGFVSGFPRAAHAVISKIIYMHLIFISKYFSLFPSASNFLYHIIKALGNIFSQLSQRALFLCS